MNNSLNINLLESKPNFRIFAVKVKPFNADNIFNLDINIDIPDDDDDEPLPIPEPPPDSDTDDEKGKR